MAEIKIQKKRKPIWPWIIVILIIIFVVWLFARSGYIGTNMKGPQNSPDSSSKQGGGIGELYMNNFNRDNLSGHFNSGLISKKISRSQEMRWKMIS
jgi:flagellar basal body-associated protein FliL